MLRSLPFVLLLFFTNDMKAQFSKEADSLIKQMTPEEKVYMVTGTGMDIPGNDQNETPAQATVGMTKDKVPGAAGTSYTIKRLGLPAIVFADGPAGIRIAPEREDSPGKTYYATAFPTATSISSSWNTKLALEIGEAFGVEGKHYGVDFLLAPALNLHRNPLGGRNFEYYSEDPLLSGTIAGHFVKGVQSQGIGATLKHFVANNSETNRMALNTIVSERALRELYLRGFHIAMAIEEPWAIMSSYNMINGTFASENKALLTDLLREEWGFKGFVMTDWFAGRSATDQMTAGNDLLMPGTPQQQNDLLEGLKSGKLNEDILDRNIRYILQQYLKTRSFKGYEPDNSPPLEKHKNIARQAAAEGMVLLKNNATLPLSSKSKIALLGNTSYATISGGTGSGDVNKAYMTSVKEGLTKAGFAIDRALEKSYSDYMTTQKEQMPPKEFWFAPDQLIPEMPLTAETINSLAENNDIGIYTLGRTSGEFQDRPQKGDYLLTPLENKLIHDLADAFHHLGKKFIVLLNIGGVIDTASWKSAPDAILLAWQPGQEAGHAIADILKGSVSPSGKLPVTFPMTLEDIPSSQNFPGTVLDPNAPKPENPLVAQPSKEVYQEDIYIGYRYFDTFDKATSYPFGHGLSYTQFGYETIKITPSDEQISIELKITNTGNYKGKEVVQIYVQAPKGAINQPKKELRAYAKTDLLNPGSSQTLQLQIPINDLGYYHPVKAAWLMNPGNYSIHISTDISNTIYEEKVQLPGKVITTTKKLLTPQSPIELLFPNK